MIKEWMAISLTALTVFCNVALAQDDVVGEEAVVKLGPKLVCDEPKYNFGELPNSESVEHTFVIRNEGDDMLVVDKVKPSCGCTVANITSKNLAPGESSEITAKLSLRGRKGTQNKQITVYSNDPKTKRLSLTLTGRAIAEIDTSPSYLNFGNIAEKESAVKSVTVKANIDQPFKVTGVESLSKLVTAELETVTEGKEYKVNVTVPAGSKQGMLNDRIRLKTDYAKTPQVDVRVTARITGKLVISPEKLILQENAERALTRYIMVGNGSVTDFKVTDVVWPGEGVTATPRDKAGRGVQIELKNVRGLKELNGKSVIIKTNVPELEEIKIPIQISPPRK